MSKNRTWYHVGRSNQIEPAPRSEHGLLRTVFRPLQLPPRRFRAIACTGRSVGRCFADRRLIHGSCPTSPTVAAAIDVSSGLLALHFPLQPCPGEGPVVVGCRRGDPHRSGCFGIGQTGKEPQLDELPFRGILLLEFPQRLVQCHQFVTRFDADWGEPIRAQDTPLFVTSVGNTRAFPDEDLAFVEMKSTPQRWLPPLRVGVEPKSRRFVHPPA